MMGGSAWKVTFFARRWRARGVGTRSSLSDHVSLSGSKAVGGERLNWLVRAREDLVGDGEPYLSGEVGSGMLAADLVGLSSGKLVWLSVRLCPGERRGWFSFRSESKRAKLLFAKCMLSGRLALGRSTIGRVEGS